MLSLLVSLTAIGAVHALPAETRVAARSEGLNWTECVIPFAQNLITPPPYPYECASLTVPWDYTDKESSETLDLDLVRVKALNDTSQGSIVFNPGGPGGSGIEFLVFSSDVLHEVLGGSFDLVAFDPRGTGKTIPFDCNHTGGPDIPIGKRDDVTVVRNMTELIFEQWDSNVEFAEACAEQMGRNGSIIGTTFAARDMARIAEALDEDGLLNYWGISYGTYLGSVFATLFPHMVGKVMLDSNVNPYEWRAGSLLRSVEDTDKAFMGFLSECINTPENCTLAEFAPNGEAEELRELYNSIAGSSPEEYDVLKLLTGTFLYDPSLWSIAVDIFVDLYFNSSSSDNSSLISTDDDDSTLALPQYSEGVNALHGIACSDMDWRPSSPEEMLPIIELQQNDSSFADLFYPRLGWPCAVWNITPAESYGGTFRANTKNPMLIANGIYDPVTPLSSAHNVSAGFNGSVVLQHNGFGHGVTSHPSLCTGRAIRRFFETGELPENGTVCEPDVGPFALESGLEELLSGSPIEKRNEEGTYTEEDVKLLKAMRELGRRQHAFDRLLAV